MNIYCKHCQLNFKCKKPYECEKKYQLQYLGRTYTREEWNKEGMCNFFLQKEENSVHE